MTKICKIIKIIKITKIKMENTNQDLLMEIVKSIIPEEFSQFFDIEDFVRTDKEARISLVEKIDLIPKELLDITLWNKDKVVLDWYCRPIELMDFPMRNRATFITLKRRRWKLNYESSIDNLYWDKSFNNEYYLNFDWMKTTKKFGLFLKGLTRKELDELLSCFPVYRNCFEETI